jgi:dihydrolipoamide dehydrogenase
MNDTVEIKVPDIGDFKDIDVIEVLVKPGDAVEKETSLITVESDKATMEIPSPAAGVVKELKLKVGDKVSEGTPIMLLELSAAANSSAPQTAAVTLPTPPLAKEAGAVAAGVSGAAPQLAPAAVPGNADLHAEVLVLGAGPGGYTAAFRAADLGKKVVLIERHAALGGVCLNVGCIPSKALLHAARVVTEAEEMSRAGIGFGKPKIDVDKLRGWKDAVVGRLTKGLAALAKQRNVTVLQGIGKFESPNGIAVDTPEGVKRVSFDFCIIAAGSSVARIPGFPYEDARLMDSTGALQLADIPRRLLVIGAASSAGDGLRLRRARRQGHGGGNGRRAHSGRRPRSHPGARQAHRETLRGDLSQYQGGETRTQARRTARHVRGRGESPAADVQPRADGGGATPQRRRHRRRARRSRSRRARLYSC